MVRIAALPQQFELLVDRVSTGSGSGWVCTRANPVATAPGTDLLQVQRLKSTSVLDEAMASFCVSDFAAEGVVAFDVGANAGADELPGRGGAVEAHALDAVGQAEKL